VPFYRGFDHIHLVDFLECSQTPVPDGGAARYHNHWGIFLVGIDDPGQGVRKPRTGGYQAHPGIAVVNRPGMRHHCRRLFMPHVNKSHPVFEETVIIFCDDMPAKYFRHFALLVIYYLFR